jgi:hypothetical protein
MLSRAVERAFGEVFTFTARKHDAADVDLPRIADGSRAAFDCTGRWEGPAKADYPRARGSTSDDQSIRINVPYACVRIANDALAWPLVNGDQCLRQKDNTRWRVANVLPVDHDAVVVFLSDKRA